MRILISTGIYPPRIGGPAQYAVALEKELRSEGHEVVVVTYTVEYVLPPLIRHLFFFFRVALRLPFVDFVIALDTLSVGWPTVVASRLFNKRVVIRTGGDFLWESYIERTKDEVLLKDFYSVFHKKINTKEKAIFLITRFTLQNANALVFSTVWQRDIFTRAYHLHPERNYIIENEYKPCTVSLPHTSKTYVWAGRRLTLKNIERLQRAFMRAQKKDPSIRLSVLTNLSKKDLMENIKACYALIIPSISEISPNTVLDALEYGKPCIVTRETGIVDRLKDHVVYVDPLDETDIERAILALSEEKAYAVALEKARAFSFAHSAKDIAREFIHLFSRIQ